MFSGQKTVFCLRIGMFGSHTQELVKQSEGTVALLSAHAAFFATSPSCIVQRGRGYSKLVVWRDDSINVLS
jgi:hypothetical protein